ARLPGRMRQRAEVDVRGDVLQARQVERIAVHVVTVVAGERAHGALRVIVLARRKAVVDDQQRAALQETAERTHPQAAEQAEFAFVSARGRNFDFNPACVGEYTAAGG